MWATPPEPRTLCLGESLGGAGRSSYLDPRIPCWLHVGSLIPKEAPSPPRLALPVPSPSDYPAVFAGASFSLGWGFQWCLQVSARRLGVESDQAGSHTAVILSPPPAAEDLRLFGRP